MLVVLRTPIDLAMWVKLHNLIANKKGARNGSVVVDIFDRADFKTLVPGEKLVLVSHGSETEFGSYSAPDLAQKLFDKNLPYDVGSIKLSGCHSGSDRKGKPFCLLLALALYNVSRHCRPPLTVDVSGLSDTAVTFPDGSVRAKDRNAKPQSPTYSEIKAKYTVDAWIEKSKKSPYGNQDEIVKSAAHWAKLTEIFFEELYALNKKITLNKDESTVKSTW